VLTRSSVTLYFQTILCETSTN